MPFWARHLIAIVIALLIAFVLAPVFPYPIDVILYWLAIVVALIFTIMLIVDLLRGERL